MKMVEKQTKKDRIWLDRGEKSYSVGYTFGMEYTIYIGKRVDNKKEREPLTFGDCLSYVNSLPPEFFKRGVKVEVNRIESPSISLLEADAFKAFVRLCEISSR